MEPSPYRIVSSTILGSLIMFAEHFRGTDFQSDIINVVLNQIDRERIHSNGEAMSFEEREELFKVFVTTDLVEGYLRQQIQKRNE